jgi:uncharacterized Tic20 family protein
MTTESTTQAPPTTAQIPSAMAAQAGHTHEVLCHVLSFAGLVIPFGNIVGPLVFWLWKKAENPAVDEHGKEVLNFQISMTIWTLISLASMFVFVGFILAPIAVITNIVLTIIGSIKASNGELYQYPLTIRLIK